MLRRLNNLEQWSDHRFAELEAEVETEGSRTSSFRPSRGGSLSRERSLSKALGRSRERLVLLEGEPGAGKSVALRHLALEMARKAMRARRADQTIPVYINLKELTRPGIDSIRPELIRDLVLRSLNRANNRDVEDFLDGNFDDGLRMWIPDDADHDSDAKPITNRAGIGTVIGTS